MISWNFWFFWLLNGLLNKKKKKIEIKIKDEINKKCEELEKCYNIKIVKMENNIENFEKDVEIFREKLVSINKELCKLK